jgi:hypothetical protein
MFPPPGTVFDPDALAALTAAYEKVVRGLVHETIAKPIIACNLLSVDVIH